MKYFFDNNISYKFARMLAAVDVEVASLRDWYDQRTGDIELFELLTGMDIVYVTHDRNQKSRKEEARALRESGVTALFLGPFWDKLYFWPQAQWLITRWPKIDAFARSVSRGTWAEIKQNGSATVFRF